MDTDYKLPVQDPEFLQLQARLREICPHRNEHLVKDSTWTGRVYCRDCGQEREWNAY